MSVTLVLDALQDALHGQPWVAATKRLIGGDTMTVRFRSGRAVLVSAVEIEVPVLSQDAEAK